MWQKANALRGRELAVVVAEVAQAFALGELIKAPASAGSSAAFGAWGLAVVILSVPAQCVRHRVVRLPLRELNNSVGTPALPHPGTAGVGWGGLGWAGVGWGAAAKPATGAGDAWPCPRIPALRIPHIQAFIFHYVITRR